MNVCCTVNRADIVEEGKEEAMTHSNIFPTFTIKDLAKALGSVRKHRGQRARTVALPAAASHAAVCWELGLVV